MTRAEHLQWAKNRAMEYVNAGDYRNAVTSMMSDLNKHDDLRASAMTCVMLMPMVKDRASATKFVQGFN
jgi:hypothetical protein